MTPNSVTIGFGRFNPPTIGHKRLIEYIARVANGADYSVFSSHSQDSKNNPLSAEVKLSYLKEMCPAQAENIICDQNIKDILDALQAVYKGGYEIVNVVVGSDRLEEFRYLTSKYNGEGKKYNFKAINVISAGERDENATDELSAVSASKLRKAVSSEDFDTFSKGLPDTLSLEQKKSLYEELREKMGFKDN